MTMMAAMTVMTVEMTFGYGVGNDNGDDGGGDDFGYGDDYLW